LESTTILNLNQHLNHVLLSVVVVEVPQAEGCMRGGLSPGATWTLLGLCVVFSPVIATGYVGYFAVSGAAVGVRKGTQMKRRGSNFIRIQRNKAIRKLGLSKFKNYLEELKTYADENPKDLDKQLEYGAALFINEDYHTAYDVLNSMFQVDPSIRAAWPKQATLFYLHGLTNQFLFDYDAAASDFRSAIQVSELSQGNDSNLGPNQTRFTVGDCYNSLAFCQLMSALYPYDQHSKPSKKQRIQTLMEANINATSAIERDAKQGSFHYNRGLILYYLGVLLEKRQPSNALSRWEAALKDFDAAIQSGTFGTGAEAFAMKAQVLALLGRIEETPPLVEEANQRDAKVERIRNR